MSKSRYQCKYRWDKLTTSERKMARKLYRAGQRDAFIKGKPLDIKGKDRYFTEPW